MKNIQENLMREQTKININFKKRGDRVVRPYKYNKIVLEKLTKQGNYTLQKVASSAGIKNMAEFHNAGYKGSDKNVK